MDDNTGVVLEELFDVIRARRSADPGSSYVARQFAAGKERVGQKVGEEAVEAVIAGVTEDKEGLIAESADLLFHLMIFWEINEITPSDVFVELKRRQGISGLDSRKAGRRPSLS
ncbi:MAG: phosphoribosyl-ATP diphosphatase [Pseudomonadota bacterium]|nr:phosphoribosyl-ATP diphosphatase [Pseudomonadota bacterium]